MIFLLVIFVFGLIIGSFLNSLIYRLETSQNFVLGRSFCPACHHVLGLKDLFPVLSFIFLKGKCRYCQKPISLQYPLVELATAIVFVLVFFFVLQDQPKLINSAIAIVISYYFIMAALLIVVFVFDLKHYLIPDEIVYSGIVVAFIYRLFNIWKLDNWDLIRNSSLEIRNFEVLLNPLASAFLAALFFYAIYHFSKGRGLGFGDVKLAFLMGLVLAFPKIIVALFFAFFSGAIIGIGLIAASGIGLMALKKKSLKSELPFGPFLVSGIFFTLFFGERVVNYYLSLLGT
ncbi:MAG: prepilin peptidase [bacterium]|nr:prepilin peptidase [bacterium]